MISHDLSILKNMCKRIAIMYLGEIVEIGNKNGFDHMVIGKAIYENKFSLDELVKLNA